MNKLFDNLKCEVKLNVSFWCILKNVGNGSCRYYYAPEKNTLLKRSKPLTTEEDLLKLKNTLSNALGVESCTRAPANTERKVYKLTNVKCERFCWFAQRKLYLK